MLAGLATGCGVEVRPRMPTLHARATVAPAAFTAEPAPAQGYVAGAPAGQAQSAPQGGYAAMPDDVATVGQYQQSGGATKETAEVVTIGSTLIGRVAKGAPRYYVIDLAVGDVVQLKTYTRLLESGSRNLSIKLIEPDEVVLMSLLAYTSSDRDWSRDEDKVAAKQTGRHVIRVACHDGIDFKLLISGSAAAK
tara:strand:+ start:85507 stop:86085 length:579 start_codon:yes stop_codon:yes gene_type:complete